MGCQKSEQKCRRPYVKFIYFEKATKFCKISTVDLTVTEQNISKVVISQTFCVLLTKPQLYIPELIEINIGIFN